jgi:hypothetical protein
MKDRNISIFKYFNALQQEWVCAHIRSKIYPRKSDKNFYIGVKSRKREKIIDISFKNDLPNIFDDQSTMDNIYKSIVGEFGFPKLIYNNFLDKKKKKKQDNFPFSGTFVKILASDSNFSIGVTDYVDIENEQVFVQERPNTRSIPFYYMDVKRISIEELDRLFYFYPFNDFKVKVSSGDVIVGELIEADFENEMAKIKFYDNEEINHFSFLDISRIF